MGPPSRALIQEGGCSEEPAPGGGHLAMRHPCHPSPVRVHGSLALLLLILSLHFSGAHSGASGGTWSALKNRMGGSSFSVLSFCVTESEGKSDTYYLVDQSMPLAGQGIASVEDYSNGKLVLAGNYLHNPQIMIRTPVDDKQKRGGVFWGHMSHQRAAIYQKELERLVTSMPMKTMDVVAVIPIGLAGQEEPRSDGRVHGGAGGGHSVPDRGAGDIAWLFGHQPLPRMWPRVMARLRRAAGEPVGGGSNHTQGYGGQARAGGATEQVHATSVVARWMVSSMRYRAEVVEEEDIFVQSASSQHRAQKAGVSNPDLREGMLRSDAPLAYVSHIDYGHRIIVSANVTVFYSKSRPARNIDLVASRMVKVIAGDLSLESFERMYPWHAISARFRWDPEVPVPLNALRTMHLKGRLEHSKTLDGEFIWTKEGGVEWNATEMQCKRGTFRRSKYAAEEAAKEGKEHGAGDQEMCPLSDTWPSIEIPWSSWVLRHGNARRLMERIHEWQDALTAHPETALQAVPLALKAKRAPAASDISQILAEFEPVLRKADANGGHGGWERADTKVSFGDRIIPTHPGTTCMRWNNIPLSLLFALGDLILLFALTLIIVFIIWIYLLSGFFVARIGRHMPLPPFVGLHDVPFRLHILSLRFPVVHQHPSGNQQQQQQQQAPEPPGQANARVDGGGAVDPAAAAPLRHEAAAAHHGQGGNDEAGAAPDTWSPDHNWEAIRAEEAGSSQAVAPGLGVPDATDGGQGGQLNQSGSHDGGLDHSLDEEQRQAAYRLQHLLHADDDDDVPVF